MMVGQFINKFKFNLHEDFIENVGQVKEANLRTYALHKGKQIFFNVCCQEDMGQAEKPQFKTKKIEIR